MAQRKRRRRRKFRKEFLILVWSVAALLILIPLIVHFAKSGKDKPAENPVSQTESLPVSGGSSASQPESSTVSEESASAPESSDADTAGPAVPEDYVDPVTQLAAQQLEDGRKAIASITEKVSQMQTEAEFSIEAVDGLPYLVAVNRAANCVTVYTADENGQYTQPYLAMVCSTGGDGTPLGVWKLPTQEESTRYGVRDLWHLMDGNVYGQYTTRITPKDGILFHSVPYFTNGDKGSLEYEEFNKLGETASLGCVRLAAVDSKWVFDNCPYGTTVVIYDDAENPGPLGKPETIKIDITNEERRGWDPTDPDENNPWGDTYKSGTAVYAVGAEKLT